MNPIAIAETDIWDALHDVPDPELPTVSVVDLGVIGAVELDADRRAARIELMPTFLGCPALEIMRDMIRERVEQLGLSAQVDVVRDKLWTSDRISPEGRHKLAQAGIAPPAPADPTAITFMEPARCPHCGSRKTAIESHFGPTLCRAIGYCRECRQPFEQFKPL